MTTEDLAAVNAALAEIKAIKAQHSANANIIKALHESQRALGDRNAVLSRQIMDLVWVDSYPPFTA